MKKIVIGLALLVIAGVALVAQGLALCPFCPAEAVLRHAAAVRQTHSASYYDLSVIEPRADTRP